MAKRRVNRLQEQLELAFEHRPARIEPTPTPMLNNRHSRRTARAWHAKGPGLSREAIHRQTPPTTPMPCAPANDLIGLTIFDIASTEGTTGQSITTRARAVWDGTALRIVGWSNDR